jgi:hypothetical protein
LTILYDTIHSGCGLSFPDTPADSLPDNVSDGSRAVAQDRPEDGGHELQVWTGGGRSVPGGTKDTSVWNAGVRYGWILTAPHGPGFLSGRFELAVDAVPAFVIFQPANTAYGGGVNPVGLKWIFATRGHLAPYLELNGGTLFTTREVPAGTSTINFTSGAVFGLYFLGSMRGRWTSGTCTFRMPG